MTGNGVTSNRGEGEKIGDCNFFQLQTQKSWKGAT
jgi:hypothetical protein